MKYWVAHARGCDFNYLASIGFSVGYPTIDDYVFLEVNEKNLPWTRRQSRLNIAFVRNKKGLATITEEEYLRMMGSLKREFKEGEIIDVVEGFPENLSGKVLELSEDGSLVRCLLDGWNRKYDLWLPSTTLVLSVEGDN